MKTRHRALVDGLHGAQFGEKFQHSLDARTPNLNSDIQLPSTAPFCGPFRRQLTDFAVS
jgi:hypothetical protein